MSSPVRSDAVIITGRPTTEQTAAVLVALCAVAAADDSSAGNGPPATWWNSRSRAARPLLSAGPGAWRASVLPR